MRGRPYWIAGALGIAFALLAWVRIEMNPRGGVVRVADVELAPATTAAPPPPESPEWRPMHLPWDWRPRGDGRDVWCRARFELAETPTATLQLLVAQAAFGANVFVNGSEIGAVGRESAAYWGRRELVWLAIPAGTLRAGGNTLLLRLRVRPEFAGYLTPLFVGPAERLQGDLRARVAVVSGADGLALVSATLAMMYWSVYRRLRSAEWAWLTAGIGALALGGLPFRAIDYVVWPLAVGIGTTCVICAAHRGGALARPRVERTAFGVLGGIALACVMAPPNARYTLALVASTSALAAAAYLMTVYRTATVARWLQGALGLRAALGLATLLALSDTPLYWNRAPLLGLPLFPIVHLPILVASFVHIVGFLADGLARSTALNRSLQESQARMLAFEGERAARAERERMQRDLHDGLGAQLVAALAAAEREPQDSTAVQRAVRLALGELRSAVDSLDESDANLDAALGAMRARLEPLVQHGAARLAWRVETKLPAIRLDPQQSLHLLRILQEAIANAVKHSGARSIEVASGALESGGHRGAFVEVRDDGRGLASASPGRGLTNMRQRARLLGGELTLASDESGTRVRVWLPAAPTP
jgi:signal transduction histidine kinase